MVLYSGSKHCYAPVAQLDRVFGYEPKGRGFESLPVCHEKRVHFCVLSFCFMIKKGRDSNKEGANLWFAEENIPVECIRWRGYERSETIGTAVPRKNPFRRANKDEMTLVVVLSLFFTFWVMDSNKEGANYTTATQFRHFAVCALHFAFIPITSNFKTSLFIL